jgi:hypothetical protein
MTTNFFSPLSYVAVFGSGIRDLGWVKIRIRDPGSGINIPDPPHCLSLGLHRGHLSFRRSLQPSKENIKT